MYCTSPHLQLQYFIGIGCFTHRKGLFTRLRQKCFTYQRATVALSELLIILSSSETARHVLVSLLGKYRLLASSTLSRRGRVGMAQANQPKMTRNCYSVKARRKLFGERESRRKCKSRLCQSMQGSHAHSPSNRRNLRSPLAENLRRMRRRRWRDERLRKPGVDWKLLSLSQCSHYRAVQVQAGV